VTDGRTDRFTMTETALFIESSGKTATILNICHSSQLFLTVSVSVSSLHHLIYLLVNGYPEIYYSQSINLHFLVGVCVVFLCKLSISVYHNACSEILSRFCTGL